LGGGLAVGGCFFLFVTSAAAYFDAGNEVYEKCIAPENTSNRLIIIYGFGSIEWWRK